MYCSNSVDWKDIKHTKCTLPLFYKHILTESSKSEPMPESSELLTLP